MTYIIIFSFILHLVSFFFIILFYMKLQEKSQSTGEDEKTKKEIEDLLISYTREMKDNNDRFLRQLARRKEQQTREEVHKTMDKATDKTEASEGQRYQNEDYERTYTPPTSPLTYSVPVGPRVESDKNLEDDQAKFSQQANEENKMNYEDYQPPTPEENGTHMESSQNAKVLALAEKGYNAKEIAQQLEMGAGEVELLLKFHQR
ncbi:DUF6115 domain-containing protein [Texcoconibacillus texcoconensis]|uniref:G:T/U-mismatch repair DNA glycosylase n=1 Tax=Texcoconibacillus texcoconensis TaxID=1095777 RepID=A0A840QIS0_9BACI|nr:hypothetical protein [Texcoconibacillus texcoconensis]MBB5172049.1 G:T/U-mismatch repair DNA glycosylase [Texcoconibacillus texcoconensis]